VEPLSSSFFHIWKLTGPFTLMSLSALDMCIVSLLVFSFYCVRKLGRRAEVLFSIVVKQNLHRICMHRSLKEWATGILYFSNCWHLHTTNSTKRTHLFRTLLPLELVVQEISIPHKYEGTWVFFLQIDGKMWRTYIMHSDRDT